jgi:hypothetical protein
MEATMTIDPAVVTSILALFGIGLIPVINFLKKLIGAEGKPALLLVLACSAAGTAIILLATGAFALLPLLIYTVAVFGEASGVYKFTKANA